MVPYGASTGTFNFKKNDWRQLFSYRTQKIQLQVLNFSMYILDLTKWEYKCTCIHMYVRMYSTILNGPMNPKNIVLLRTYVVTFSFVTVPVSVVIILLIILLPYGTVRYGNKKITISVTIFKKKNTS